MSANLGQAVLAIHLAVIAFNVGGLIVIPLGAWRGWRWVRSRRWRLLHLVSLAVVALQAALGRDCFLTLWQSVLTGEAPQPLITRWVNTLIYWRLAGWVFSAAYLAAFVGTITLWVGIPPLPMKAGHQRPSESSGRRRDLG